MHVGRLISSHGFFAYRPALGTTCGERESTKLEAPFFFCPSLKSMTTCAHPQRSGQLLHCSDCGLEVHRECYAASKWRLLGSAEDQWFAGFLSIMLSKFFIASFMPWELKVFHFRPSCHRLGVKLLRTLYFAQALRWVPSLARYRFSCIPCGPLPSL